MDSKTQISEPKPPEPTYLQPIWQASRYGESFCFQRRQSTFRTGLGAAVFAWVYLTFKQSMGARIRGTLGDIDPSNTVPFKRAKSRVQKGVPFEGYP